MIGKGNKERLVPLGETARYWLERYLLEVRPELPDPRGGAVFPGRTGALMTRQTFWHRIKHWASASRLLWTLSPHTLRHAFATHLVNHGADLRVVQLLGHEDLHHANLHLRCTRAIKTTVQRTSPARLGYNSHSFEGAPMRWLIGVPFFCVSGCDG